MTSLDALNVAHDALRKAVRPARKQAHKTEGKLASAFRDAMRYWDELKARGGTLTDLVKGLEQVLRDVWPKGECSCPRCRWACQDCEDTGAMWQKRPARIYGGRMVDVIVPCHCARGVRFMPASKGPDDFAKAGRSKPTRIGR